MTTVPSLRAANPYQASLEAALMRRGVEFRDGLDLARITRDDIDVVHLHWPEFLYTAVRGGPLARAVTRTRARRLRATLRRLRASKVGVVWTLHNLRPHESVRPRLDHRMYEAFADASDVMLAHSSYAADLFADAYGIGRERIVVAPHGNYDGAYPPAGAPREHLREALDIQPTEYVFLAFGQLRDYKRLPELVRSFGDAGIDGCRLIVAGRDQHGEVGPALQRAAAGIDTVTLEIGYVDDQRLSDLHHAADAAVLNYRDVFSSGALLLAWTLGLPVLLPEATTGTELATWPAVLGFEPDGIGAGLERLSSADRAAQREAALDTAARFGWDTVASIVEGAYERAVADAVRV